MLDFLLNHRTVLFSKKTAIMSSIHVICIKESHSVSNFWQGRFPMSLLLGFFLHAHRTPHMPRICLGNIFPSKQYKLGYFSTGSPQPLCQDYPKSTASVSNCKDDGLEPHHGVQSCSSTAGTGPTWWQRPKGVLLPWVPTELQLTERHEVVKTHMNGREVPTALIRKGLGNYDFHLISPMPTDTEHLDPIEWWTM